MRRRIVMLLLMLLPFQFAWSAAAGYCTHETATAVKHFGHHLHVHEAGRTQDTQLHAGGLQAPDDDCSACHLSAPTLPPYVQAVSAIAARTAPPVVERLRPSSAIAETPERPNWPRAA